MYVPRLRHPELVSGSMPHTQCDAGCIDSVRDSEAWMMKQVQHDEVVR